MNKRCTESSCRKTFSTLDAGGRCPHCGKSYPQLYRSRKRGNPWNRYPPRMKLSVSAGKETVCLNIRLDEMLRLGLDGKKLQMIKLFRTQVMARGYCPGLMASKEFCESLMNRKAVRTAWRLTGGKWQGLERIEPAAAKQL